VLADPDRLLQGGRLDRRDGPASLHRTQLAGRCHEKLYSLLLSPTIDVLNAARSLIRLIGRCTPTVVAPWRGLSPRSRCQSRNHASPATRWRHGEKLARAGPPLSTPMQSLLGYRLAPCSTLNSPAAMYTWIVSCGPEWPRCRAHLEIDLPLKGAAPVPRHP
jgi:hypothetical protein